MAVSVRNKTRFYNGLVIVFLLLIPVCNLGAIRFGSRSLFHDEAELVLFTLYAAPLWMIFSLIVGFELYRQAVMKISPRYRLVLIMAIGGLAFSALADLLCPVGPAFLSVATLKLALASCAICGGLGLAIRYFFRLRQAARD